MKPRFLLFSSVFALACGDSTPDPGADGGLRECSADAECCTFAQCGGPNNVQVVSFCESCFARPDTHVCESERCQELPSDLCERGQIRVAFDVPPEAVGARSVTMAVILPTDSVGNPVDCARLLGQGPELFDDRTVSTTNSVAVALTPPGDPDFGYATLTSAPPGPDRIVYLAVTSESQGKGARMAEGCVEGILVVKPPRNQNKVNPSDPECFVEDGTSNVSLSLTPR